MLAGSFAGWAPAAAKQPEPEQPESPPPRARPRPRARPAPVEHAAPGEPERLVQPAAPPRRTPVGTDPGAHRAAVTGRKPRARKGDALKKCPTARLQKLLAAAS